MLLKIKLCIISIVILFLSGCWDIRDTEDIYYIDALGFDIQNGKYITYAQFINFSNVAKTEMPSPEKIPVSLAIGTGRMLIDTGYSLYTTSQRKLSFEHIKTIVISEKILKQGGLKQVIDFLSRFVQFRKTMWIFATNKPIEEILTTEGPLTTPPTKTIQGDPRDTYEIYSRIEPLHVFQFEAQYFEPGNTSYLPSLTISKKWKEKTKPLNQLKYDGASFFANKRYIGKMTEEELIGLKWTKNDMIRAPISVMKNGVPIAKLILREPKIKIKPIQRRNKTIFQLQAEFKAHIFQLIQEASPDIIEKYAERELEKQIQYTYQTGLQKGIDVYQLSHKFYRDNVHLWKRQTKHGYLPLDKSSLAIKTKINIQTSGQLKIKSEQ